MYRDASQTRHGFTWSKGAFTSFDVPGSAAPLGTVGIGINDHEDVVGDYVDANGNRHGFVRRIAATQRSTFLMLCSPSPRESTIAARS